MDVFKFLLGCVVLAASIAVGAQTPEEQNQSLLKLLSSQLKMYKDLQQNIWKESKDRPPASISEEVCRELQMDQAKNFQGLAIFGPESLREFLSLQIDLISQRPPKRFSLESRLFEFLDQKISPFGGTPSRDLSFLKFARCEGAIDDVIFRILASPKKKAILQVSSSGQSFERSLGLYEYLLKKAELVLRIPDLLETPRSDILASEIASKKLPDGEEISLREILYSRYSPAQMLSMGQLMVDLIKDSEAIEVAVLTTYIKQDGSVEQTTTRLAQTEIIRFAWLRYDEKRVKLFPGSPPSDIEVLAAAYETLGVDDFFVKTLLEDTSFYQKPPSMAKKALMYSFNLGRRVLLVVPQTVKFALLLETFLQADRQGSRTKRELGPQRYFSDRIQR